MNRKNRLMILFAMLFLITMVLVKMSYGQEPKEYKLGWDPNPVEEQVDGYRIYLNGVQHGQVMGPNTTEYTIGIGPTVPPGCWTVTAFNALESDHSDQVCRTIPEQSAGLRIEERNP